MLRTCRTCAGKSLRHARRLSTPSAAAVAPHELLLARTYLRSTGKELAPGLDERTVFGGDAQAAAVRAHELLWSADFILLSHGTQPSPVMAYGNQAAMDLFETSWEALAGLESRYTAPPDCMEDREGLLRRVSEFGFIDDYGGTRVTSMGRRFTIDNVTVWEVFCPDSGVRLGQAATFKRPPPEPPVDP